MFRSPVLYIGAHYVPVKSKLQHPPWAYLGRLTSFPVREGGNFIASLDFMSRVALIPRGFIIVAEKAGTNFDEFKRMM